jgi:hypothetical protein
MMITNMKQSNRYRTAILALIGLIALPFASLAQEDTLKRPLTVKPLPPGSISREDSARVPVDSALRRAEPLRGAQRTDSFMRAHSPRTAAIRSAILPGLGQIYNKKYWKLPIIYGALGVTGAVFVYNLDNYRDLRFAYRGLIEAQPTSVNGVVVPGDSTRYWQIRPDLRVIGSRDLNAIRSYRDEFRRNIDYTVIAFILLWGLNVVDATVDAHLKPFDVSPDLSLKIKAGRSPMARTTGLSLILAFK